MYEHHDVKQELTEDSCRKKPDGFNLINAILLGIALLSIGVIVVKSVF